MRLARLSKNVTRKRIRQGTGSSWSTSDGPNQVCRNVIMTVVLITLSSIVLCSDASSPSIALEAQNGDGFVWQRDKLTGAEIAASQNDSSINFLDVGDLSIYSLYLVQQVLSDLSDATGKKVDRDLKKSSIAIFHDTNVFSRLKTDRQSFTALGIPDDVIDDLRQRITDDAKCISTTRTDDKNNIIFSVILLSEKFNNCLIGGLNNSFGLHSLHVNIRTLIDGCVLYEGRRRGLRDRQSLSQETPRLRDLCLSRAGEIK
jgi:hypothetical protein